MLAVLFIHYLWLFDLEWREEAQLYLISGYQVAMIAMPHDVTVWMQCWTCWLSSQLATSVAKNSYTLTVQYVQHHVFIFLRASLSLVSFFSFFLSTLAGIIFDKPFLLVLEMLLPKVRRPILMLLKTIPWISCFRGWKFWCYVWSCVWRAISWWTATEVMLCVELE